MKHIILMIVLALSTGCAGIQSGYVLDRVAMDQQRIATCGNDYIIKAVSTQEVMKNCGNWLGCTHFKHNFKPAVIYYKAGHPEVLAHEQDHCIAGGPLHVSDMI